MSDTSERAPVKTKSGATIDPTVDEVTYIPEDGDPHRVNWNGVEFKAYVPTKIARTHTVLVPMPVEVTTADGTVIHRHVEKRVPMVEIAKGNHKFSVNGETPEKKRQGKVRVPTSPDEYRGYAIAWIAGSTAASAMDARWEAEAALRDKCGVEDRDIAYLRPFFEARHEEVGAAA